MSPKSAGHTTLPWKIFDPRHRYPGIDGGDGRTIVVLGKDDDLNDLCGIRGVSHEESIANAELIVKAVNSYGPLRDALQAIVNEMQVASSRGRSISVEWLDDRIARGRAALALGEEL